jgi:hypothetical protein
MRGDIDHAARTKSVIDNSANKPGQNTVPSPARTHLVPLLGLIAFLSGVSTWVHAAAIRPHLEEYRPFGLFFIVITVLQVAWTLAIVVRPSRRLYVVGAIRNAAIVVLWLVSRTTGLPIGPEPWAAEAIGRADLLATGCELVAAVGCVLLLRRDQARDVTRTSSGPKPAWAASSAEHWRPWLSCASLGPC